MITNIAYVVDVRAENLNFQILCLIFQVKVAANWQ